MSLISKSATVRSDTSDLLERYEKSKERREQVTKEGMRGLMKLVEGGKVRYGDKRVTSDTLVLEKSPDEQQMVGSEAKRESA